MKKLGILLLACITALNLSAKGYKFVVDGLEYKTWGSASYSIETYFPNHYGWEEYRLPNMVFVSGARRDISVANIPATVIYNGVTHNVIGICPNAFSGCYNLRVVTIPESVVSISPSAFDNSLLYENERNWHDDVLYVDNCIIDCRDSSKIDHVARGKIRLIADDAFTDCKNFRLLVVKNTDFLASLDCFPWEVNEDICELSPGYYSPITLILPADTVTNGLIIQGTTLVATTNKATTTSITVPDYIDTIGYGAFQYCRALESVTISANVRHIVFRAFDYCDNLRSITVEAGNSVYDSRDNCNAINETKTNTMMFACKATTIPTSITSIGDYAFAKKELRKYLILPDHITSIGHSAFERCENLEFVHIGNSVESIGYYAFKDCISLEAVTIPYSVTSIGGRAFESTALYNDPANWENGALYIDDCLIEVDRGFVGHFRIKENTRVIAGGAFEYCFSLKSVTIPNSVTSIGWGTFKDCTSLTAVTIPKSVTSIRNYAFMGCESLTSVTIPNSVTSIGGRAFEGCTSLTSVTIPKSVKWIGENAFPEHTKIIRQ